MRPTTIFGILLVVLGVAMLLTGGFSYKKDEQVLDAGPLHASVEHTKHLDFPPVVSGVVMAAGVALLFVGKRQRV